MPKPKQSQYTKRVMPFVFEDTTPFEEGQIAYDMGMTAKDNPFHPLGGNFIAWKNGFNFKAQGI